MFPRNAVIITAAGSSERFNQTSEIPSKKEFIKISGHTVLYHSISPFLEVPNLCAVFITYKEDMQVLTKSATEDLSSRGIPFFYVKGGKTRQESVFNALKELYAKNNELNVELVSIHDGARPFVSKEQIMDCLAYAKLFGGAVPGIAIKDTLARISEDGTISDYAERKDLYAIQTPQTFRFPDIFNAHISAIKDNKTFTDDSAVFKYSGNDVIITKGDSRNTKITYAFDLEDIKC